MIDAKEPVPGEWLSPNEFAQVVRLTPLVSIDLLIRNPAGHYLVGRRLNDPAKGTLFVPGGRITKNERIADAFRRVCRGELGREFPFETARFAGVYEHFYATNRFGHSGFGTHYVVLAYAFDVDHDVVMVPDAQHAEYVWMPQGELLSSNLVQENTKAYFRQD